MVVSTPYLGMSMVILDLGNFPVSKSCIKQGKNLWWKAHIVFECTSGILKVGIYNTMEM